MLIYDIVEEPKDDLYHRLLDYGLQFCPLFLLVRQPYNRPEPGPASEEILRELGAFFLKSEQADEWPGTRVYKNKAEICWFEYNPSSANILKNATSHLYQWEPPDFPDDLCLMRNEQSPWLVTITEERDSYLELELAEFEALKLDFPELAEICAAPRPRNDSEDS